MSRASKTRTHVSWQRLLRGTGKGSGEAGCGLRIARSTDCELGARCWVLGAGYSVLWHLKLAQKVHAFSYNARAARATAAIAAAAAAAASWEIVNYLACRRRKTAVEAAPE